LRRLIIVLMRPPVGLGDGRGGLGGKKEKKGGEEREKICSLIMVIATPTLFLFC